MTDLFIPGEYVGNSGKVLQGKVECDALTDTSWLWAAEYVARRLQFCKVIGVPTGGFKFAEALEPLTMEHSEHVTGKPSTRLLIVDDVMTTGGSMERMREELNAPIWAVSGYVLFVRTLRIPLWITPIWRQGR